MKPGDIIGPFTLGPTIGRGGMATVFQAVHKASGTAVALKVLRTDNADDPLFVQAFKLEVEAASRLGHERITNILAHGFLTETETQDQPQLCGLPWLALELVEGGTIAPLAGNISWSQLQAVGLDVLDAIAHAHARGIMHRDIKPGNVLLESATGRVKLSDFGLAHPIEMHRQRLVEADTTVYGTPYYMAPEQIECNLRLYGPWTDLYAVGAMMWKLATGHAPYRGEVHDVLRMHTRGILPTFEPKRPMPDGLAEWIRITMHRDPDQRFRRAADAAWALQKIQEGDATPIEIQPPPTDSEVGSVATLSPFDLDTFIFDENATQRHPADDQTIPLTKTGPANSKQAILSLVKHELPPFPLDWRRRRHSRVRLSATGQHWFGHQKPELDGYEPTRDQMWNMMRRVIETQEQHAMLIEGPHTGILDDLTQWFCIRVDEVGGGMWVRIDHQTPMSIDEQFGHILLQRFGTAGRTYEESLRIIEAMMYRMRYPHPEHVTDLARLTMKAQDIPLPNDELSPTDASRTRQRVIQYLHTIAKIRPLLFWMNFVDDSMATMHLLNQMLNQTEPVPILIMITRCTSTESGENPMLHDVLEAKSEKTTVINPVP